MLSISVKSRKVLDILDFVNDVPVLSHANLSKIVQINPLKVGTTFQFYKKPP